MRQSFTLIEVLIFVTVFSLFYVVAIATVTVSLRNMKINEHRMLATHYGQELLEWLRGQKDIDWNVFSARASPAGRSYCFNSEPISAWPGSGGCGASYNSLTPAIYNREATLSSVNCGVQICQVDISVLVTWREFNEPWSVPIKTSLTIWE